MCLFSIEIQTAGRIGTKFGTEVVLEGGKVLGVFFLTQYPTPPGTGCVKGVRGASGASTVHTPDLVGAGHLFGPQIRKDLGPLNVWSHGHSL